MDSPFETRQCNTSALGVPNTTLIAYLQKQLIVWSLDQNSPVSCQGLLSAVIAALLRGESPDPLTHRIARKRFTKTPRTTTLNEDEAQATVQEIQTLRQLARATPKPPGSRKLDKFRAELIALRQAGASLRDLQFWLQGQQALKISVSTLQRHFTQVSA